MKVIRDEDKKSNKYIMRFEVEKGKRDKYTEDESNVMIKRTTEDYNNLVVYMADGSKPRYDNIEENKVRLLQLMTEQHLRNKKELEDLKKAKTVYQVISVISIILTIIFTIITQILNSNIEYMTIKNILEMIFPSSFLVFFAISNVRTIKVNNKIKEIKKNDYLLENEEVLNQADLNNKNILENVKDKDITAIAKIKQEKDKEKDNNYFDINSIGVGDLSLDALKRIKANIERENYLGLIRTDEETKGKSYVKK